MSTSTYGAFVVQHPIRVAETEQEAVNHVLTGTALAARATEDEVLFYAITVAAPPTEEPPPPVTGDPTEIGIVQWPVAATDTDIAFVAAPTTVVIGSIFLIDAEYMVVNDVSNADNIGVTRGSYDTVAAAHAAGAQVFIYAPVPQPPSGSPTETGIVQWEVKEMDTDIALTSTPTTVVVGSVFLIDLEYMIVSDISNPDNPQVTRAAYGSAVAVHAAGAEVSIWGQVTKSAQANHTKTTTVAKQHSKKK